MIDVELARLAASLLSTAAAELVEDEHLNLTSEPRTPAEVANRADQLARLGGDVAILGQALGVILRRSDFGGGA